MTGKIKQRHAPFRIWAALLYSPESSPFLRLLGPGLYEIDRPALARQLETSSVRVREGLEWLHLHSYISVLQSERGRSTVRFAPPRRTFSERSHTSA